VVKKEPLEVGRSESGFSGTRFLEKKFPDTLFPDDVSIVVAKQWMGETPALPDEEINVAKAVQKRKREFRAGRHCAHAAINALLNNNVNDHSPITVAPTRQACWPVGIVGSISHSGTHCSAIVASTSKYLSLGHDVEKAKELESNVHKMICTKTELSFIARHKASNLPLTTIIFSAKESIHKTYSPINGHMLDFLDAEIELDLENQRFKATIINPEPNPKVSIPFLAGAFSISDGYIYTGIYLIDPTYTEPTL